MGVVMVKGRRKKGFCTLLLNCGKFYGCFFLKKGGLLAVLQHRVKLFIKSKLKFQVPNNSKIDHTQHHGLRTPRESFFSEIPNF